MQSGPVSLQPQEADSAHTISSKNGDKSLNKRMIELLKATGERQFTAEDVQSSLPDANLTSIRSGLARLADQGKIKRVGRGQYQGIE